MGTNLRSDCTELNPWSPLGSLDCPGPYPHFVLVGWRPEPNPDSALGPGNGVSLHPFLHTVLP